MLERNNIFGGILEKMPLKGSNHDFPLSIVEGWGNPKKSSLEVVSGYLSAKFYCSMGIHGRGM
jgi:hypothetical protein